MKANELRVGNVVNLLGSQAIIIPNDFQKWFQNAQGWENKAIKPIPLTEDWLIRFGFVQDESNQYYWKNWGTNGVQILKYSDIYRRFTFELGQGFNKVLDNVHQLQNLYYALTENELEIK